MSLGQAINAGLRKSMLEDERVMILGEDVGALGGVFRVTEGLQKEFGDARVVDSPLAESAIVGTAIGLALHGYRPVCEIQFDGFVYPAFDQIVSQLAKFRARSAGSVHLPIVIRIPSGGGIGAVEHHSESNEAYFMHTAGLRVVSCSDPADAYRLIRGAIACDDPVVFLEPKRRYWDKGAVEVDSNPGSLDRARVLRTGSDVVLMTHGPAVQVCMAAAEAAAQDGASVAVVDLRTLAPLDVDTIERYARQCGRVVVVHEASTFMGLGAEVAATVMERCFGSLKSPVARVGAYNLPYPPANVEDQFLPNVDRVLFAIDSVLGYSRVGGAS